MFYCQKSHYILIGIPHKENLDSHCWLTIDVVIDEGRSEGRVADQGQPLF